MLRPSHSRRFGARRLMLAGGVGVVLVYGLFVVTGYAWLHYVLKNERAGIADVALLRWHKVRQAMAADQFAAAKKAWETGDYHAAYLAFNSAVRNDPDNIDGRLLAARFLGAASAINQEVTLLEDGLRRAPDDRQLIEQTFALLTASGRDRRALELLRQQYATKLAGPNGAMLRTVELLATLNAEGATAAKALLDKYADLRKRSDSAPTVARVLWETHDRLQAIDLLSAFLTSNRSAYAAYIQLAQWQSAAGMADDALQTAQKASQQFPKEAMARILLLDMLAAARTTSSPEWRRALESYLKDFGEHPEGITLLADLAGQKGWVGLARTLYEVGATRQQDLGGMALFYSDALNRVGRPADAAQVLAQIDSQAEGGNPGFLRQLRRRQIEVEAARGDHDRAREYARRLASALHGDREAAEGFRRRFAREGITEATAEFAAEVNVANATPAR